MSELKDLLNAEILPLAVPTGAHTDDPSLFESLEVLAADIGEHLKSYQLTVSKLTDAEDKIMGWASEQQIEELNARL